MTRDERAEIAILDVLFEHKGDEGLHPDELLAEANKVPVESRLRIFGDTLIGFSGRPESNYRRQLFPVLLTLENCGLVETGWVEHPDDPVAPLRYVYRLADSE